MAQERIEGGTRIYIGRADQGSTQFLLSPGPHTFRITYNTDRQIRYFNDHDELYWNVTGNGWLFPILRASATVTLPDGVLAQQLAYYTGPIGGKGQDASASQQAGRVTFATTRPLAQAEGLTIAIKLPKG